LTTLPLTLPELFKTRAPMDKMFVRCDDGTDYRFSEFWTRAGRFAAQLKLRGVKPGDRVAVQCEKHLDVIVLFWACARGGFVFLPLNPAYTEQEVSYFMNDAEPAIFVRDGDLAGFDQGTDEFGDHLATPDGLVAILYTSGTTGRSKGAMITHWNLASNALALISAWGFTQNDILLHALPVFHTHGLFTAMNTALFSGAEVLFRQKFDPVDVLTVMPKATVMMGVPTFYTRLLQQPGLTRKATAHMRLFISGSAPLLAETHAEFRQRTGQAILERYGMTETNMNTSNPVEGDRRAGTVGLPLPGTFARINEKGVIEVKGPNVFKGYWRHPEKTQEEFTSDGYFITGDLGQFSDDGYLTIDGRAKDIIISGGLNIYPKEVELLLDAMPVIAESAVFGVPHPDFGEAVVAAAVVSKDFDEAAAIAVAKKSLAGFKVPKRIFALTELPRNSMGKVQKVALRETYRGLFAGE
jgi:malonyl-CoA/methylmalonyl-CoA synthetase